MTRTLRNLRPAFLAVGVPALLCILGWLCGRYLGGQWRLGLAFAVGLPVVYSLWHFRRTLAERPERLFLVLGASTGLLLCAFMPAIVSVSWDGYVHYKVSNALAQGDVVTITNADATNFDMDGIYKVGLIPWGTSDDDWTPNWRGILTEKGMEHANGILARQSDVIYNVQSGGVTLAANTVGRVPNALGLWIGDLFHASYLVRLFLGRVTNLLVYLAISYLALRRLVTGKRLLMAILLAPTLLYEACNYTYDPFCIAMLGLAAASFVGELQRPDRPLTAAGAAWILVPFLLGILIKAVFIPAGLFLLFMPREKFRTKGGRGAWIGCCIMLALFVIATFALPFIGAGGSVDADTRGGQDAIDSAAQLSFVLHHPLRFLAVMAFWGVTFLNPVAIFQELLVSFCYLPQPLLWPLWSLGYLGLLALLCVTDRGPVDDGWPQKPLRISLLVGLVLAYCLCAFSLYLGYTNVGAWYILGMQTRYLLMFLPLTLLLLLNFGTGPKARLEAWLAGRGEQRPRAFLDDVAYGLQAVLPWAVLFFGFVLRF